MQFLKFFPYFNFSPTLPLQYNPSNFPFWSSRILSLSSLFPKHLNLKVFFRKTFMLECPANVPPLMRFLSRQINARTRVTIYRRTFYRSEELLKIHLNSTENKTYNARVSKSQKLKKRHAFVTMGSQNHSLDRFVFYVPRLIKKIPSNK